MPIDRANDPIAFRDFLEAKLAAAPPDFTLDDALARWEAANREGDDRAETLRAIREGLADVEAGRTRPLEEFDREFRERRGLSTRR
jgi:predicted transcriptional regulator